MAEETFRPEKRKITREEIERELDVDESDALAGPAAMRNAIAAEGGQHPANPAMAGQLPFQVKGTPPPGFMEAMNQKRPNGPQAAPRPVKPNIIPQNASSELAALLEGLKESQNLYEPISLPSKGKFYNGSDGPTNGVIHVRAMTGEEEQILATPRFVRKGQAINMIFQRCMKEQFRSEDLLTVDRTYLLIWLRGISYTPDYEVEVKCPECERKFSTVIDLNTLDVEECPDDFSEPLVDVLPKSGYQFGYRLSRGKDETEIQDYRDRRVKAFGDSSTDDTLVYRTAMLLENIEGVSDKRELQILVKNLPVQDVAYIRGLINEPPFGVDTSIPINCPGCIREFSVELPLEANFFFPRRKKKDKTQA